MQDKLPFSVIRVGNLLTGFRTLCFFKLYIRLSFLLVMPVFAGTQKCILRETGEAGSKINLLVRSNKCNQKIPF